MPRLFTGIAIPSDIREQLARLQSGLPGVRWQQPRNLHVTLCFLGEVDPADVPAVEQAMAEGAAVEPFPLHCNGVGYFGPAEAPRVLWAGIGASDALVGLRHGLDRALRVQSFALEEAPYRPHITLGRKVPRNADTTGWLRRHAGLTSTPFRVEEVVLYESRRDDQGVFYRPRARQSLNPTG